jgi:hypothetical protein
MIKRLFALDASAFITAGVMAGMEHLPAPASLNKTQYGGERGIRTLDRGLAYTPLAGARLQPLGHLSKTGAIIAQV